MNEQRNASHTRGVVIGVICMALVVVSSNYLVQFPVGVDQVPAWFADSVQSAFGIPLNELLTWGAFTYPAAFLVNDLTNRKLGRVAAAKVVVVGFIIAVILSIWLATPRIALASGLAFLVAQLLDARIFHALRGGSWWRAPVVSSTLASIVDTLLFFSIAFVATGVPWLSLAAGDYTVKLLVAVLMLVPFRILIQPGDRASLA